MELRQYVSIIWKWLWLIILATSIAALVSLVASLGLPKTYQASTTLLVGSAILDPNPAQGDLVTSSQLALTYIKLVTTEPVLKSTIDALGFRMSPDQLGGNVNAIIVQGTQLIVLTVRDTNPQRAQALANELGRQLTLQGPSAGDAKASARVDFVRKQLDDLQNKIDGGQDRISELQKSITLTSSAREIADTQQQIGVLQGQINQWQATYSNLLQSVGLRSANYLSVVEPASLPTSPVSPNVQMNVLLAAAVGMLLAMSAAFLIEYIDDTVKTPDDVSQLAGLANIGNIGYIWGDTDEEKLIVARYPRSSHAEAYRLLRTNMQVVNSDEPFRTLLVTSPNQDEGKTITAANLAVVMAQAGQRVILVDADMRRPSQHKLFHLSNDYGLTQALLQLDSTLNDYIQPTAMENLGVITTGGMPPNPADLLGSKRMQGLLERLKAKADIIILDSPPSLARADATILARQMDAVLLVLDAGHTRRDAAIHAKQVIERAGGQILGVALNRVEANANGYYYYYSDDGLRRKPKRASTMAHALDANPLVRAFTASSVAVAVSNAIQKGIRGDKLTGQPASTPERQPGDRLSEVTPDYDSPTG